MFHPLITSLSTMLIKHNIKKFNFFFKKLILIKQKKNKINQIAKRNANFDDFDLPF